jgi:hypothetical protein
LTRVQTAPAAKANMVPNNTKCGRVPCRAMSSCS